MQIQPIESLTREQAVENLKIEREENLELRTRLAHALVRIEELERDIEAIGAGGVGAMMGE